MSNRVEDLERQVAELQAAVNGLTEELVEMKERVRQLEDERSVAVEEAAAEATAGSEATDAAAGEPAAGEPATDEPASDDASEVSGGERTTHSDDHVDVFESVEEPSDGGDGEAATVDDASEGDDVIVPEQSATTPDADAEAEEAAEDDDDGESSDSDIIVA
ncbi:bZIP transcription factor [Halorubrum ruber]|uniref:BZIP transcription factor n=1 Tax=Halorubrum ruber TaxID=2982524 RepID=A0A8T8LJY6_9EURY|nr:bZIP transcription factor [Halorubrum ruber]QUO47552.1 bZIP transcription factor [Halorubrum ruber]